MKPTTTTQVALSLFGAESQSFQTLDVATIQVEKLDDELIPISFLIVPTIATTLFISCKLPLNSLPHLKGLKLANPAFNNTEFNISILIGTNHYWSFVQDHIICGDGPTAQQSRLHGLLAFWTTKPYYKTVDINISPVNYVDRSEPRTKLITVVVSRSY